MFSVILALAQITITGPPPPGPPPPQPKRYIFSGYDYPPEAVTNHWQGTVVVDLVVGADGSPKSCATIKSSGHPLLDDTTCGLLMSRGKFTPETDKNGRAIESHFRPPSVKWRLKR